MPDVKSTQRALVMQRSNAVQYDLIPEMKAELGGLTRKLEKLIHTLEWIRIEEWVISAWCGIGRPPHDRGMLANAFVAKAVLGLTTTRGLIERLSIDRALRRLCCSSCGDTPDSKNNGYRCCHGQGCFGSGQTGLLKTFDLK